MLDAGGGTIVNISSAAGIKGVPGMAAFAAAKARVIALTRTAALDYSARNIRVNAIARGPILAGPILNGPPQAREQVAAMVPVRRMGQAEEVAAAAVWLSSVQSSFVTGTTLSTVYRVYGDGGDPGKLLANAAQAVIGTGATLRDLRFARSMPTSPSDESDDDQLGNSSSIRPRSFPRGAALKCLPTAFSLVAHPWDGFESPNSSCQFHHTYGEVWG